MPWYTVSSDLILPSLIRAFRPVLEAYDLTYPQYIVMHSLWYNNQVSLKALSHDSHLDSGTLTPIVKRLEAKGLLTRQVSSEDERKKVISLTEQGMQLKIDAEELTAKLMARSNMSMERIELLRELTLELHTDLTKTDLTKS
ncbi:MarR family transcriptional regulator [Pseudoalteromonas sp. Hal040]|uniref:MarR family winged helix-turn-helix transcriptional regulator n=1 Tax=unclassified Pseudoalteromonas TaxID=194690 RepID=UPI00301E042B